jgi:hypothetical protein
MNWLLTGLATIYCNLIGALMLLFAGIFFVGGIVAIVCYEPGEGGEEDADQQQTERRTI